MRARCRLVGRASHNYAMECKEHGGIRIAPFFFFKLYGHPRDLPSFPTRRSSDLFFFCRLFRRSETKGRPPEDGPGLPPLDSPPPVSARPKGRSQRRTTADRP